MRKKIAQLLLMVLIFSFLPVFFVLADEYELKIDPKIIYEGEEVSVYARAKYNEIGTCTKLSGVAISNPPNTPCTSIIDYGDGMQDNLKCYGPILTQPCDDKFAILSVWQCICQTETTHVFQTAQSAPYVVELRKSNSSSLARAQEEVTVLARPTITPTSSVNPLRSTSIADIIHQMGNGIFIVGAAGTFLMLLIGGYYLMFARGNPSMITKGKRIILISFIGFVILALARGIVYFVENIFRD